jgi:uncharacterized protein YutE (UPF0331/DUF86 family)
MDPDIVKNKLESLHRCLARIESRVPASVAALEADVDAQDILVLNLERAVQLSVDIGSHILVDRADTAAASMASVFALLAKNGLIPDGLAANLARAVGFRNVAVHEYNELDWNIVYAIVTKRLVDFYAFASIVLDLV